MRGILLGSFVLVSACQQPVGEISVCGVEEFDAEARRCNANHRDGSLTTGEVICSLPVEGMLGQKIKARMLYLDDELLAVEEDIGSDSGNVTFRYSRAGVSLLPGGAWRCELTVGEESRTASFRSDAEDGPFLDTAVCPTSAANWDADVRLCKEDLSAQGFQDTTEITCSATLAGTRGKRVSTLLMRSGAIVGQSQGIEPDLQLTVYAKHFPSDTPQGFGAGNYSCRFRVDDVTVAEKPFTVTPR
ncbi:MAG: hypothetical protein AB2A00_27235 [Myxococcota bacterium]